MGSREMDYLRNNPWRRGSPLQGFQLFFETLSQGGTRCARLPWAVLGCRVAARRGNSRAESSHDEVHMLGHEDTRPKIERMLCAGGLNCVSQPLAGAFCLQKLKAVVAREREFMSMSRRIDGPAVNSVSWARHNGIVAFLAHSRLCFAKPRPQPPSHLAV